MNQKSSGRRLNELSRQELQGSPRISVRTDGEVDQSDKGKMRQQWWIAIATFRRLRIARLRSKLARVLASRRAITGGVVFGVSFALLLAVEFSGRTSVHSSSETISAGRTLASEEQKERIAVSATANKTPPHVTVRINHLPMKTVLDQFANRFGLNVVWHDMPSGTFHVADGQKRTPQQVYTLLQSLCRSNGFELAHRGQTLHVARLDNGISMTSFQTLATNEGEPLPEFAPLPDEISALDEADAAELEPVAGTAVQEDSEELKTLFEIETESSDDGESEPAKTSEESRDPLSGPVFETEEAESGVGEILDLQDGPLTEGEVLADQQAPALPEPNTETGMNIVSEGDTTAEPERIETTKTIKAEKTVAETVDAEKTNKVSNVSMSAAVDLGDSPSKSKAEGVQNSESPVQEADSSSVGFTLDFDDAEWGDILTNLARSHGYRLQFRSLPPGKLTSHAGKIDSLVETLDIINGHLVHSDHLLVRNSETLAVVRLSQGVPSEFIRSVAIRDVGEFGKFEYLSVAIPVSEGRVEILAREIKPYLGSAGRTKRLHEHGYLVIEDFGGNIRPIKEMLDESHGTVTGIRRAREFNLKNIPALKAFEAIETLQAEWAAESRNAVFAPASVVAEVFTNKIQVRGNSQQIKSIADLIEELDADLETIEIQAVILEVNLEETYKFSSERGFHQTVLFDRDVKKMAESIIAGTDSRPENSLARNQWGMSKTNGVLGYGGVVLPGGKPAIDAMLNILSTKFYTETLSRPTIRTLDRQSAEITIGSGGAGDQTPINSIGVSITPSFGPLGQLVLETTCTRKHGDQLLETTSTMITEQGDSVVLGGLVQASVDENGQPDGDRKEVIVVVRPSITVLPQTEPIKPVEYEEPHGQATEASVQDTNVDMATPATVTETVTVPVSDDAQKQTPAPPATAVSQPVPQAITIPQRQQEPVSPQPIPDPAFEQSQPRKTIRGGLQNLEAQAAPATDPSNQLTGFEFDDVPGTIPSGGLHQNAVTPVPDPIGTTFNDPGSAAAVFANTPQPPAATKARIAQPTATPQPRFPTPNMASQSSEAREPRSIGDRFRFLRTSSAKQSRSTSNAENARTVPPKRVVRKTEKKAQSKTAPQDSELRSRVKRFFLIDK